MSASCDYCGKSATLRCGTCKGYQFCSHECSDALADEHYEACEVGGEMDVHTALPVMKDLLTHPLARMPDVP